MEDGTSPDDTDHYSTGGLEYILSEESVSEGLSIKQMSDMTGLLYVNEIDKRQRKRTNIAFSSYVNSSNVSNSGL